MAVIHSTLGDPPRTKTQTLWVYNGLDCMLTLEVFNELIQQLDPIIAQIYFFELALQGPVLDMMRSGLLIDQELRWDMEQQIEAERSRLQSNLDKLASALEVDGLNPNSPQQMQHFFFAVLKLPPIYKHFRGEAKITLDRDALEKLKAYLWARPFINHVLAIRDNTKLLSVLRKGIDPDSRIRTSYNITGTETGRFSSSGNAFGTGDNLQNWTDSVRIICVADPGHKLAYIDLEQAESRVVGAIAWRDTDDDAYLRACESSDLHTSVTKMVWPNLGWTTDETTNKKKIAGAKFYRDMSYRDMAKRLGHGSNYMGGPQTMAKHLKIETSIVTAFQDDYFRAFPGIRGWHKTVEHKLRTEHALTTCLGRRRCFFGRSWDSATLREAIAYEPQSVVADVLNTAMLKVWQANIPGVKLLAQVHDAILIQYPESQESDILPKVLSLMDVPIQIKDRTLIIPSEASVGWNWAKATKNNPDGLEAWRDSDARTRTRQPITKLPVMDRRLY